MIPSQNRAGLQKFACPDHVRLLATIHPRPLHRFHCNVILSTDADHAAAEELEAKKKATEDAVAAAVTVTSA